LKDGSSRKIVWSPPLLSQAQHPHAVVFPIAPQRVLPDDYRLGLRLLQLCERPQVKFRLDEYERAIHQKVSHEALGPGDRDFLPERYPERPKQLGEELVGAGPGVPLPAAVGPPITPLIEALQPGCELHEELLTHVGSGYSGGLV